jgi:SPOR domain
LSDEDDMSFSGSLSTAETNLGGLEHRLRTLGAQQRSAEDALIVELARRLAPPRSSPHPQAVSEPGPRGAKPMQPLEMTMLRPSIDQAPDGPSETATVGVEAKQASDFDDSYSHDRYKAQLAAGWTLKASALALGSMVMIGALFDLAMAPPGGRSLPGAFAPAASISGGTPVAATVNTQIASALTAAPPPMPSPFPDPKAVPSIPLRPDGTPIATWAPSATEAGTAAQTSGAAKPAAKPPPKAGKSTARVVVATADTSAPAAAAETPVRLVAPAKPEKATSAASEAPQAAAQAPAAPPALRAPAQQPANPLAHAFGDLVGALAAPAASAKQPVHPTPAAASGGWAVQLAAPKSETEARTDAERLNAKYASALDGATIGVHEAQADGATVYRLRVIGLSKADAATLCRRVKRDGGHCFIVR